MFHFSIVLDLNPEMTSPTIVAQLVTTILMVKAGFTIFNCLTKTNVNKVHTMVTIIWVPAVENQRKKEIRNKIKNYIL